MGSLPFKHTRLLRRKGAGPVDPYGVLTASFRGPTVGALAGACYAGAQQKDP